MSRRSWTSKEVAEICALKRRLPASAIAKRFGVSRFAITGLWFRAANGPGRIKPRAERKMAA